MYYWVYLLIAILTEVVGTLALKYFGSGSYLGLGVMYVMLLCSYLSLVIAVKRIPLAIAYGAWESIGLILITLASALLFAEPLTLYKVSAIIAIIIGLLLLEEGTEHYHEGVSDE